RRLNNGPGPEVPSDLLGAQVAKHEARRIAWTPEAKQISDLICVAGSRSTSIVPVTSGNRTDRDPIEESGEPCGENRSRETGERRLRFKNRSRNRQRVAELARMETRADVLPRVVLCRQVTDGVICTSASEALP